MSRGLQVAFSEIGKTFGDIPSLLPHVVHGEGAYEAHLGLHSAVQPLIKLQRPPSFVVRRVDIRGM